MKIYTKTGDGGETGLFGGARVSKSSRRVCAYGEVDELNSAIGWAAVVFEEERRLLHAIQSDLFDLGAELASDPSRERGAKMPSVEESRVSELEHAIDASEEALSPLKTFVLPGGSEAAARLHLCRTICRRAERSVIALGQEEPVRSVLIRYLNRLSDLLFSLARLANQNAGVEDIPWVGRER